MELEALKKALSISGEALDDTLTQYIGEVKEYMLDAGVTQNVMESESAIGCIVKGASDLWLDKELSNYFYQRVSQLALRG